MIFWLLFALSATMPSNSCIPFVENSKMLEMCVVEHELLVFDHGDYLDAAQNGIVQSNRSEAAKKLQARLEAEMAIARSA